MPLPLINVRGRARVESVVALNIQEDFRQVKTGVPKVGTFKPEGVFEYGCPENASADYRSLRYRYRYRYRIFPISIAIAIPIAIWKNPLLLNESKSLNGVFFNLVIRFAA